MNLQKCLLAVLFLVSPTGVFPQTVQPCDFGFKELSIQDAELGDINFYVDTINLDQKKPLLIFEHGSGGYPSVFVITSPEGKDTIPFIITHEYLSLQEDFHYVDISKPGTPFLVEDTVEDNNFMHYLEYYKPTKEYEERLSLEWRVAASSLVIDYMCDNFPIDTSKIIVWGVSEGAAVAPAVAVISNKVTHVVSVNGPILNSLFSPIINIRNDEVKGNISGEEAQEQIDKLYDIYRDIYKHPDATDKYWYNHPYKRWGSFAGTIQLKNFLKLDVPIYLIGGSKDRNSPVLDMDYLQLEFIRHGKTNLTYEVCVNCDHWLNEQVFEDGKENTVSHKQTLINNVVQWIGEH